MVKTVVITRPAAQAGALAEKVAAIGRAPIVFPLLDIRPLQDASGLVSVLEHLREFSMVAFVSPNAIDACFAHIACWPSEVAIAVMGEGSRAALATHGVTSANATIVSPRNLERTDSQTLLESLDLAFLRGRNVLIVRGEGGRELLADGLRDAGVQVTQVAAYRRSAPVLDAAARAQLRRLIDTDADWIITSSEALRILVDMVGKIGSPEDVLKLQRQRVLTPHVRIQESARSLGFDNVVLTSSGDERLISALQLLP